MDNDFGFKAMREVAKPDIMDILTGRLFFRQCLCYIVTCGYSLLIKFNLITFFVFDLLEYCVHDIYTLSILLKLKLTSLSNIVT